MTGKSVTESRIVPVILCGGAGSRLWPLSRDETPKQFLRLGGGHSLLVDTVERAVKYSTARPDNVVVVTLNSYAEKTVNELNIHDPRTAQHIIAEPMARDTAAAIASAAWYVKDCFGPHALMWIMPADHHIGRPADLRDIITRAASIARTGKIVTFGMRADRPETGYGYIRAGSNLEGHDDAYFIDKFIEKPDRDRATSFIAEGCFTWNSGMFVLSAQTAVESFTQHCPAMAKIMKENTAPLPRAVYETLPSLPFDRAIMEKTDRGVVIPCDIDWSDVGTWESLWHIRDKDARGNALSGRTAVMESENCLIESNSLLVAAIGLQDVAIVEDGDSILVADRKNPDAMRALVAALGKAGKNETIDTGHERRPWGMFRTLSTNAGYKIKEIIVTPGHRLSLQYHLQRCEFWTIIEGRAEVTIGDRVSMLGPQQNCFIPVGIPHRLKNAGDERLVVVEVQCGTAFDEDDIVRCHDDYGRIPV